MMYYLNNYPMGEVRSAETFPQSERLAQDDIGFDEKNNVPLLSAALSAQLWDENLSKEENLFTLIKFLGKKTVEHSQALQVAEDQIKAILRNDPFIPQYFGFKDIKTQSGLCYQKDSFIMWPPKIEKKSWTFCKMGETSYEFQIDLEIPNAMIGYMVMASLGIVSFDVANHVET